MKRKTKQISETLDGDRPIIIEPVPNGGWVIRQKDRQFDQPVYVGAYTTTADMLADLTATLTSE